jgi:TolB protein
MNSDGSNRQPVTVHPGPDYMPNWTPDGQAIAFGSKRDGKVVLVRASLSDHREEMMTAIPPGSFPRLSPDGREILFHLEDDGPQNLWKLDLKTGTRRQITSDGEGFGYGAWSPDGKRIAGELRRGQSTSIAVIPEDGGTPIDVVNDPGQSWVYSWAPDNDRIAFAGLRDGTWNIYTASVSTRKQTKLTSYTSPRSFVRYPAWSPAGDQIVYEFAQMSGNVYIVDLP